MNRTALLMSVFTVELMAGLLGSVFQGRQVAQAGCRGCIWHLFQFDDWSAEVSTRFQSPYELGWESGAEGSSWVLDLQLTSEKYLPFSRSLVSAFSDLRVVWFLWCLEAAIKVDLEWKGSVLLCGLLECHRFSYIGFWEKGCTRGQWSLFHVLGICTPTRIWSGSKFPADKTIECDRQCKWNI